jgi:hypothetical protein
MKCSTHPEIDATGACTYSGKPYCGDCLVEVSGKLYAKPNLAHVMTELKDANKSQPHVFMNAGGGGGAAANQAILPQPSAVAARKTKGGAYGRWCFSLIGICGIQRYYLDQPVLGTIYLLTLGLLGVGQLFDLFVLGNRVDVYNALHR